METYSKGYDSEQDVANHSSEGGRTERGKALPWVKYESTDMPIRPIGTVRKGYYLGIPSRTLPPVSKQGNVPGGASILCMMYSAKNGHRGVEVFAWLTAVDCRHWWDTAVISERPSD